jgi:GMP synthase-like glutamine amidotransferase
MSATNSVKAMESRMAKEKSKSARIIKAIYRKKGIKETLYDWEKSEKGGSKEADAKIIIKGGKTMTGQERDTVEIDPVLKTKLNSPNGRPN